MIERIATWAKGLEQKNNFWGITIRLFYEICVNAGVQSAVHVIASCLLGALCYKEGSINWKFVVPFTVVYFILIVVFYIANSHRKTRNNSIRGYEISYSKISKALQEECRKDVELFKTITDKSLEETIRYYDTYDVYTETCFRVCAAVNDLLEEISGIKAFRVMTFLRTTNGCDEYYINAYSPQEPAPEAYSKKFGLDRFKQAGVKKKEIPVHARPFLNKRFEPIIYINREVKKEYADFNDTHPTKVHISIPCSVNSMVVAVLQITSYEDCLGSRINIEDLIKNVIVIYTSYLKTIYMHQIQHDEIARVLVQRLQEV